MTDDLSARLRVHDTRDFCSNLSDSQFAVLASGDDGEQFLSRIVGALCDATDRIDALQAENERLTAERDGAYERAARVADDIQKRHATAFAVVADVGGTDADVGMPAAATQCAAGIATAIRQLGRE